MLTTMLQAVFALVAILYLIGTTVVFVTAMRAKKQIVRTTYRDVVWCCIMWPRLAVGIVRLYRQKKRALTKHNHKGAT